MTEIPTTADAMSRRRLITGAAAAAAGAGVLATLPGNASAGAPPIQAPDDGVVELDAFASQKSGLTYLPLDGRAFQPETEGATRYDGISGVGLNAPPGRLLVNLPVPVGSTIREIAFAYQGQPYVEIVRRQATIDPPELLLGEALAIGGGPKTQTLVLNQTSGALQPVPIAFGSTYVLRLFLSAGDSIYGATVGYTAPTQTFVPFTGDTPRILDTRAVGGGGKLQPGEVRTVNLGFAGARSAVLNVAIVETEGAGGFLSVFRGNIDWPGNASVNWFAPNQILSNCVVSAVDSSSRIRIRAGVAATHVVIDRLGFFV